MCERERERERESERHGVLNNIIKYSLWEHNNIYEGNIYDGRV